MWVENWTFTELLYHVPRKAFGWITEKENSSFVLICPFISSGFEYCQADSYHSGYNSSLLSRAQSLQRQASPACLTKGLPLSRKIIYVDKTAVPAEPTELN